MADGVAKEEDGPVTAVVGVLVALVVGTPIILFLHLASTLLDGWVLCTLWRWLQQGQTFRGLPALALWQAMLVVLAVNLLTYPHIPEQKFGRLVVEVLVRPLWILFTGAIVVWWVQ